MILQVHNLFKKFPTGTVIEDISFDVQLGEFLTLLGPSGCGKTTLLRIIAGLEAPDQGRIFMQGKDITYTPASKRSVNMIFQNYALFPHMNVFENISFGLSCKNYDPKEIESRTYSLMELMKLERYKNEYPSELSGGQRQRVAVARALVNEPNILLLDEPLSALDYQLRQQIRIELKRLQRQLGITFILITHDQEEALSISDRIIIMDQGKVLQIGTPREIYETPSSLYVAKFIGQTNIFECTVLSSKKENLSVMLEGQVFSLHAKRTYSQNNKINLLIRPEDFEVWHENEIEHTKDMLPGRIEDVIYKGSTVDLVTSLESGKFILATEFFDEDDEDLTYRIGEKVWLRWIPGWEVIFETDGNEY